MDSIFLKRCDNGGDTVAEKSVIVQCSGCATKNRIPGGRLKDNPLCGKCRAPLSIFDSPVNITDSTFNEEVIRYRGSVMVDCWAPWCGPCRMVAPALEQLAKEYAGRIKITKLNVDENSGTASKYFVKSIPTMLLFKDGKLVNTLVGALPKQAIEEHIRTLI